MFKEQETSVPNPAFFPIPNPCPLLRSFDIPEPIILPPGIDPYAVLNPNPHGLPALDVDPSAASWSQIITKTTDLTVSEHAGGSWSEPTIASAMSHSSANSEVVAQQTVTVTKAQIENTHSIGILCDVCKITCNNEEVLSRHKEGKRHLKNMQKLAVSSAITQEISPPAEAAATLCPDSEKTLQKEASVDSLFVCAIPDVGDISTPQQHLNGEKHAAQVTSGALCRDELPNPKSVSATLANSGTQKAQDELNVHQFVWCKVCNVSCTSHKTLGRHILGKKHRNNLKMSEQTPSPPSSPVGNSKSTEGNIVDSEEGKPACIQGKQQLQKSEKLPLCPSTPTPSNGLVEHEKSSEGKPAWSEQLCKVNGSSKQASGKKNMKNLQKSKEIPDLPSPPIASLVTPPTLENPKSTKDEIVNSDKEKSARCELCGICCNSYDELNRHMSGKKHQKNLKKSEKLFGPRPAPAAAARSLQDSKNEGGKVAIVERCKRKALGSEEDEDSKKQKKRMKEEEACGSSITCKMCNVVCNSLTAFTSHLAGHKHSAMALKQVKAGQNLEQL